MDETMQVAPEVDPFDGVGELLTSMNNYERLYNAENSVQGYSTAGKKQKGKLNKQVRENVNGELNSMFEEGTVKPGEVNGTYQSSFDKGKDFGGEVALDGVYGNDYVLHGHYGEDGTVHSGSVGLKHGSDPYGMRVGGTYKDDKGKEHNLDDGLGGDPGKLAAKWALDSGHVS